MNKDWTITGAAAEGFRLGEISSAKAANKIIQAKDRRIAELEAEVEKWIKANAAMETSHGKAVARVEQLEAELRRYKCPVSGNHRDADWCECGWSRAKSHPNHCLCDDCVTPENMVERLELSKIFMEREHE